MEKQSRFDMHNVHRQWITLALIPLQLAGQATVNFAITSKSYVLGYMTNKTLTSGEYNWTQLISGFGWIVRRLVSYSLYNSISMLCYKSFFSGQDNVKKSITIEDLPDTFVTEKAPRTGICVARNGTLILAEVSPRNWIVWGGKLYLFFVWRLMVRKI